VRSKREKIGKKEKGERVKYTVGNGRPKVISKGPAVNMAAPIRHSNPLTALTTPVLMFLSAVLSLEGVRPPVRKSLQCRPQFDAPRVTDRTTPYSRRDRFLPYSKQTGRIYEYACTRQQRSHKVSPCR